MDLMTVEFGPMAYNLIGVVSAPAQVKSFRLISLLSLRRTSYPFYLFLPNPRGRNRVYNILTKIYSLPNSGNLSGFC
jgi:hypothetical protein